MSIGREAPKPKPPVKKLHARPAAPHPTADAVIKRPFSDDALFEKLRQQSSESSNGMTNPRRVLNKENNK